MKFLKYICLICSFLSSTNLSLVAQNTAEEGLDNIFRTSDEEGETAAQPNRRKGQRTAIAPKYSNASV